jgi:general secretion pathway protein G
MSPKNAPAPILGSISKYRKNHCDGFTLIEVLIVIAIIATLAAIAIPAYSNYIQRAKIARCIEEVRMLDSEIAAYHEKNDKLPDNLNDLGRGNILDPWGNPYQFLNFANVKGKGKMRKDRNLVPINAHFDLYSMGKDGKSQPPLTAKVSHDDIIRANNGSFIGIASGY